MSAGVLRIRVSSCTTNNMPESQTSPLLVKREQNGVFMPAEWEAHDACWLAWPSHEDLWGKNIALAQREFINLCQVIGKSEKLEILVLEEDSLQKAKIALMDLPVQFHVIPFGDIWLRDTAPLFLKSAAGKLIPACFEFNGWGGKFHLPFDDQVAQRIAQSLKIPTFFFRFVLEGGSIECDGQGTCLTSEQCNLNPNRNPDLSREEVEAKIKKALGVTKILWLKKGLLNDHTDGHIDTLARFVAPGKVVCMESFHRDDPNKDVLSEIANQLSEYKDAHNRSLEVIRIPSPGPILDENHEFMPASYLNFYISNRHVIIPTYGSPYDAEAVQALSRCFPERQAVGLSAKAILSGGGAFHCITQQQPRGLL